MAAVLDLDDLVGAAEIAEQRERGGDIAEGGGFDDEDSVRHRFKHEAAKD